MNISQSLISTLSLAAVLLTSSGCENADAQREVVIQNIVLNASKDLRKTSILASAATTESSQQVRQSLNSILGELRQVNDARGGQQAARSMLAATALHELARLDLAEIERMEADRRIERIVLHDMMEIALRLDSRAAGLANHSGAEAQQYLEIEKRAASEQLHEFSEAIADLDGPLAESTRRITEDSRRIAELEAKANQLRRHAAELGHESGLPDFLEAVRMEREADRIEFKMANRAAVLDYEIQPEHQQADHNAQFARQRIDAVASASATLATYTQTISTDTSTTRQSIDGLRTKVRDRLNLLHQEQNGKLSEMYARATETLSQAAAESRKAASGSGREGSLASNMMEVRLHSLSGQLQWSHATGLNDHEALIRSVQVAELAWGGSDDWTARQTATHSGFEEAHNNAKASFTRAREILSGMNASGSTGRNVITLQQGLDDALKGLDGEFSAKESIPLADSRASRTTSGRSSTSSGSRTAKGFDTPKALLQRLIEFSTSPDNMVDFIDLYHSDEPTVRRRLRTVKRITTAMSEVSSALIEQFGADAMASMGGGMPGMSSVAPGKAAQTVSDFRPIETNENRIVYNSPDLLGPTEKLTLIQVNNRWFIHIPNEFSNLNSRMDDNLKQTANQLSRMKPELRKFAKRIRNGEFSNIMEAMMAMGQFMGADPGGR